MFRTLAVAVVTAVVAVSGQLLTAPASADSPDAGNRDSGNTDPGAHRAAAMRCVTVAEFRETSRGMAKARVHGIFGTAGSFGDGGAGGYSRIYPTCAPKADCDVLMEYNVGPRGVHRVVRRTWNGVC